MGQRHNGSWAAPDNRPMFLKAGALSLALLLASRLLGLLRESALASAFGVSGLGDVAVLMLTLPDWLTGVLASGALAYVLLPHWAQQSLPHQEWVQRRVASGLLGLGLLLAAGLVLGRAAVVQSLLPGLGLALWPPAECAMVWAAAGLPGALLAALWVTRLQHERDFAGMYGASLVVNAVLITALWGMAWVGTTDAAVTLLGIALGLAMVIRLLWLARRLRRGRRFQSNAQPDAHPGAQPDAGNRGTPQGDGAAQLPAISLWVWAALSAGLPLLLPFVARTLASGAGEGALAAFNYAWKLVELPLMLAVQLVATLAFPAITRALTGGPLGMPGASGEVEGEREASRPELPPKMTPEAVRVIRQALALAWTLACAATLALQVGATAIADLLFGWGRMDAAALSQVAEWGRVGAWGLLPQALIAVAVTVLAALGRMRMVVLAYGLALAALLGLGTLGGQGLGGAALMAILNTVLTGVALALLVVLWRYRALVTTGRVDEPRFTPHRLLPWQAMAVPGLLLAVGSVVIRVSGLEVHGQKGTLPLILSCFSAIFIIAIAVKTCPEVRQALRR